MKQPHVSRSDAQPVPAIFSVERLMDFLVALGQDVEITVRPTRKTAWSSVDRLTWKQRRGFHGKITDESLQRA